MVAIFALASFLGAALLFLIEPMLTKLVLPYFGGSPMVWNTCTLVFQLLLLAGYIYAHLATRRLGPRRQPWLHLALVIPALLLLPVALPDDPAPPPDMEPTVWLLRVVLVAIGLPFAVLATTGPLLQRWFSWTGHRRADDPYFLYAASNAGSVVGLLGYPFVIEPHVGLSNQTAWWSLAYVVFAVLIATCGVVTTRAHRKATAGVMMRETLPARGPDTDAVRVPDSAVPNARHSADVAARDVPDTAGRRLSWVALAFIPSSLMLGVSTHVSTDIAAIPLFWTVPLAVYLATFVVAFARTTRREPLFLSLVAMVLAVAALMNAMGGWPSPVWMSVTLHLSSLAAVGLAAHARLAATRPPADRLTSFYLLVAVGGAFGGLLNGFIAPVVLDRPVEYPVVLALVPLLLVSWRPTSLLMARRAFAILPLALLMVVASTFTAQDVIERDRTFYGSYRVTDAAKQRYLYHGTTMHGSEVLRGEDKGEPTSYYTRRSPIGDVMKAYGPDLRRIAFVGMGVGTLAAYGRSAQQMDFYEIDPAVVRIARDSGLFTYLSASDADVRVIVGDGRLELSRAQSSYGLIVLDAFSSDAIPAHLLTTDAIKQYRRKLKPDGIIAIHISNRHLRLDPVLAAQARALDMVAVQRSDPFPTKLGSASTWVVMARTERDVRQLLDLPGWSTTKPEPGVRAWTDDYSSLVEVLDAG